MINVCETCCRVSLNPVCDTCLRIVALEAKNKNLDSIVDGLIHSVCYLLNHVNQVNNEYKYSEYVRVDEKRFP